MKPASEGRDQLKRARLWVVKAGSSVVTDHGRRLDVSAISSWCHDIAALRESGCEVVVVSSGAVAGGMARLGWKERPNQENLLQAAAAIGQNDLVSAYSDGFARHKIQTGQLLLTHDDLADRRRHLNARDTLNTLLGLGIVPILNENDTVTVGNLCFGDNDTLAAMIASIIDADALILLTDVAGLHDRAPTEQGARLLSEVQAYDSSLASMIGPGNTLLGRGGMKTKIEAARRVASSGTLTVIAPGAEKNILLRLREGVPLGTLLTAVGNHEKPQERKRWLRDQLARGELRIDAGATRVLQHSGSSLLAVGVCDVRGNFNRGELVVCMDPHRKRIAQGLVNYSSEELRRIARRPSSEIEGILGYINEPEVINRDNLVVL